MLVLRAYMTLVDKYSEQNPNLVYDIEGPLFVNSHLTKYKTAHRTLNTSFVSEAAGVGHLMAYDFRRMWATYVGSSKSNMLRQFGALAASHR